MPNWCYNALSVDATTEGGKILVEAFRPKYKDDRGQLYARPMMDLYPFPPELDITARPVPDAELDAIYKANQEKFGASNWYDWCIKNWGTKWDCSVMDMDEDDPEDVRIYFDTAWSPPTDFFKWFAEKYPDSVFECEYEEEGIGFEGKTSYNAQCGFHDECWDSADPEDGWED